MNEFVLIMPEIFLVLTLAFVVAAEVTYYGERVRLITATSLLGLGAAFVQAIFLYEQSATQIFGGVLSIDGFSLFFKLFFILIAGFAVAAVPHSKEIIPERRAEYCALILSSTLAMCLLASVSELALAFLALMLMNIISQFLAAFGKRSILSTEAAVKAMVMGVVGIALFLYAVALLFASTKSLNIYEIHRTLVAHPLPYPMMLVIFTLSFLAMSFQMGGFPSYLLVPDVLEGAPTPVSAYLSLGTRAASFAFATRFFINVFTQPGQFQGQWQVLGEFDWTQLVAVVSGLTMGIGVLLAFRQTGAKRLVSYLIVAETGFLLMGLLVLDEVGIAALLFNLVIELFALMGIFFVLSYLIDHFKTDRLEKLNGVLRSAVPECICLVMFLLCLVGSPPTPGFIGKFALIGASVRHGRYVLAIVAVMAMVLGAATVARLTYHLIGDFRYFKEGSERFEARGTAGRNSRKVFLAALVVPMIMAGVFADFVFHWAGQSLGFIFW